MKRLLLILSACALLASSAQAGGFLNLNIGGGRVFGRNRVVVQRQPVFVQRQFVHGGFVPQQRVFVQQQFVPSYGFSSGFSAFGGGYGVQSFGGGCGSLLSY